MKFEKKILSILNVLTIPDLLHIDTPDWGNQRLWSKFWFGWVMRSPFLSSLNEKLDISWWALYQPIDKQVACGPREKRWKWKGRLIHMQERGEGRKNQEESTEYGEIVGFNSEKGKGFKKAWKR